MERPMYIQREINFKERELPTVFGVSPAPAIDEATIFLEATGSPSACVINFFEARDRLPAGLEESSGQFETHWKAGRVAVRRIPSVQRVDLIEESFYWLLSATALAYFLLWIIGR